MRARVSIAVAAAALVATFGLVAAACGTTGRATEGNVSRGKELFQQQCASCHTLADAGSQSEIGPNLDEAFRYVRDDELPHMGFDESTIRDVVRTQIAYPVQDPPTDSPGMPANLVTGDDADAVASYVASVAGLPVQGGQQAAGGDTGSTDGRTIFTGSAGCGGCHTLSAAGTSGTIGPNLDEAKPSQQAAEQTITNGRGQMPAFKGRLTPEQITAVAKFVAENAGR